VVAVYPDQRDEALRKGRLRGRRYNHVDSQRRGRAFIPLLVDRASRNDLFSQ
jgi:hypothetical protein